MSRAYRRAVTCWCCHEYVDDWVLSWSGEPLCASCMRTQRPANVAQARRAVGGPLATRKGHFALAAHALGWPGAIGAAGVVTGLIVLVSGADQARRGSLLVLSFGLLLIACSFVSLEDAAIERWKHLVPKRTRRRGARAALGASPAQNEPARLQTGASEAVGDG